MVSPANRGVGLGWNIAPPLERAVVVIVREVCTEPEPGMTAGGLKLQDAPVGRFEQPSVTLFVNAPPCAASVIWYVALCPAVTVAVFGEALTEKLVTVI